MENNILKRKNIVIGVTGGIACYKALDLVKELRRNGANVHIIMTESSTHLVDIQDFEKASGNEVQTTLFHPKIYYIQYIKKNKGGNLVLHLKCLQSPPPTRNVKHSGAK